MLTYPIPGPDGAVLCNWLWYRNFSPGLELTDLLTDRTGFTAELTVPPGSVQDWHIEQLHSAADTGLPAPLAEVVRRTAEPFIQVIVDLEVPRMAFGRSCLIGDAAFACVHTSVWAPRRRPTTPGSWGPRCLASRHDTSRIG